MSVRLAARVDQYVAAMRAAQASTTGFSRSTERNLQRVGTQMQGIGRKMTTFVTLPIVAAGALTVKAAMDWESAFAGVTKTVDGTASQMADLEQGLRDMAKELPATHSEIAAVAEAAGQLGVGVGDIEEFTKVMIDLGETTNLSADEAATALARFMNIMGTSQDDVSNLASAVVDLGNNSATTEAEIVEMSVRLAAAGRQAGLSESDVLAFSAALTSVGVEAEAGGTAFSKVFAGINTAVIDGGEKLETFAAVAGVSVEQFRAAFEEDAAGAIALFIDGIGGMAAQGQSTTAVLKDLGIGNERTMRAVLSLGQAEGLLTELLGLSSDAWAENTALTEEAEKRYATTAAQFEMVRNKVVDLGIDLGRILLPAVKFVVDAFGELAEMFQGLPGPVQGMVLAFGGLLAAVGPLVFIGGTLIKNFVQLRGAMALLGGAAGGLKQAFGLLGVAAVVGLSFYGAFTASQRRAEENTRRASEALDTQFFALLAAAEAAATSAHEVDSLAVANEALSRSIAEGNDRLADSAAQLNVGAEQILDVLALMDADGEELITTIDFLSRSFGLSAEQADFVATHYRALVSPVGQLRDETRAAAAEFGITEEQLNALVPALQSFLNAADDQSVQQIALDFLNARVEAEGLEGSLVGAAEAQAGQNRQTGDAIAVYRAYAEIVANTTDEQREAAGITEEMAGAISTVESILPEASGAMDDFADSTVSATDAWSQLERVFDAQFIRQLGQDLSGIRGPAEGWETVLGLEQLRTWGEALHMVVDPQIAFVESQDSIWESALAAGDALSEETSSLEDNTAGAMRNRGVVIGWVKDILAGADAQLAMGDSVADVTETLDHNIASLRQHLISLGLDKNQIDRLLRSLGIYDDDWVAVTKLQTDLLGQRKLEQMLLDLDEFDEEFVAEILAIAETDGAFAAIDHLERHINSTSATVDVNANVSNAVNAIRSLSGLTVFANVISRFRSAHGRFVPGGTNMLSSLGEEGPEVVLPLDKPGRMSALLGMPQVFGPVVSAISRLVPAGAGLGAASPQGGVHVQSLSVGSRDDVPAAMGMLNELEWRLRVAA